QWSELLNTIPFPHDLEAAKEPNMSAAGRVVYDPLHLAPRGSSQNPRRVLQVHQDQIDPALLDGADTAPDRLFVIGEFITTKDCVGPHLPNHQIGSQGKHILAKAGDFLADILATESTVQDSDLDLRKTVSQLCLEATGIAHRGRAGAGSFCR